MEPDYKAIGQRIRIARIHLSKTQESIADAIDVTPAHMSNIETGKTKVSLPTLISIANALNVSMDDLLCDNLKESRVIFEGEAKNLFADCNDYEFRFLVDLLKSAKEALRRNETVRKRLDPDS